MKILYKNASIFYEFKGQGKPVVFLHGFLEDRSMWDAIANSTKGVSTLLIDLPGHGESQNFDTVYSMDEMALVVKAILDKHKIATATFIGHSMGGYVCLAMAAQHPAYIKSLILVNSTPLTDSPERLKNRRQAITLLGHSPERFIGMAIQNLFDPENLDRLQPAIDTLKAKAISLEVKGVVGCVKGMMARPDRTNILANLKVPKVVIASIHDPIINCNQLAQLSISAGAQFAIIPGGHMSSFEQPSRLKELLLHFIK